METNQSFPNLETATSLEIAKQASRVLFQKMGIDIRLIYAANTTVLTDYYVVCSGRSSTHCRALAHELEDAMAASLVPLRHLEGVDGAEWILADFGDVIVHIFGKEARDFYRFERLFGEDAFVPLDDLKEELKSKND